MTLNPSKSRRSQSGPTLAHGRFKLTLHRTGELLKIGLTGLSSEIEKVDDALKMLPEMKGIPGPRPKDWEPHIEGKKTPDGDFYLTMDPRTAHLLRFHMKEARKEHRTLRFHLYSVLAVYVWGAFETYLTMLFEELFTKRRRC